MRNEELAAPEQQGSVATACELLSGDLQPLLPQGPQPGEAVEQPSSGFVDQGIPGFAEQQLRPGPRRYTFRAQMGVYPCPS